MIESPEKGKVVLVNSAPGHSLPLVFEGLELPIKVEIIREVEADGELWLVMPCPPFGQQAVQVHKAQMYPYPPVRQRPDKIAAQFWTTERMMIALFNHTAGKEGGTFGIGHPEDGDFNVGVTWGSEAPDSPMAGAAAYGTAGTLRRALMQAGADAGLWEFDDSDEPSERQERILIVEAEHPAEMNINAIQGSMTLLADADRAYVFSGDKGAVLKDRDRDIGGDPFSVAVAVQRRSANAGAVERVARAIHQAGTLQTGIVPWEELYPDLRKDYELKAMAALDAAGQSVNSADLPDVQKKEIHIVLAGIAAEGEPPRWEFVETEWPDGSGAKFESHIDDKGLRHIVIPIVRDSLPFEIREGTPVVTITVPVESAKSFLSDSAGWGAEGLQIVTESLQSELEKRGIIPPYKPDTEASA